VIEPYSIEGLIAATYTPLDDDGELKLDAVGPMVDYLLDRGVKGLYVCGSTGEGVSLTASERRKVAEEYVRTANGRVQVVVQVGHNSLRKAHELAAHAQKIGADAVSAVCPSYFKPATASLLVDSMAEVASGAPDLPFYYYHIPAMTGVNFDMTHVLDLAGDRIENLCGLKYTAHTLHEYQVCRNWDHGRFDVLWGHDEMLLAAVMVGCSGAVGSTYNIMAPLYRQMLAHYDQRRLDAARDCQSQAVQIIRTIGKYPFHPAAKEVLKMLGHDMGACRLPLPRLSSDEVRKLRSDLEEIEFFQWTEIKEPLAPAPPL
jgi:N-acetylneuraminate lyase